MGQNFFFFFLWGVTPSTSDPHHPTKISGNFCGQGQGLLIFSFPFFQWAICLHLFVSPSGTKKRVSAPGAVEVVPIKRIRKVDPAEEGAYIISMPKGSTPRTQKILQQKQGNGCFADLWL